MAINDDIKRMEEELKILKLKQAIANAAKDKIEFGGREEVVASTTMSGTKIMGKSPLQINGVELKEGAGSVSLADQTKFKTLDLGIEGIEAGRVKFTAEKLTSGTKDAKAFGVLVAADKDAAVELATKINQIKLDGGYTINTKTPDEIKAMSAEDLSKFIAQSVSDTLPSAALTSEVASAFADPKVSAHINSNFGAKPPTVQATQDVAKWMDGLDEKGLKQLQVLGDAITAGAAIDSTKVIAGSGATPYDKKIDTKQAVLTEKKAAVADIMADGVLTGKRTVNDGGVDREYKGIIDQAVTRDIVIAANTIAGDLKGLPKDEAATKLKEARQKLPPVLPVLDRNNPTVDEFFKVDGKNVRPRALLDKDGNLQETIVRRDDKAMDFDGFKSSLAKNYDGKKGKDAMDACQKDVNGIIVKLAEGPAAALVSKYVERDDTGALKVKDKLGLNQAIQTIMTLKSEDPDIKAALKDARFELRDEVLREKAGVMVMTDRNGQIELGADNKIKVAPVQSMSEYIVDTKKTPEQVAELAKAVKSNTVSTQRAEEAAQVQRAEDKATSKATGGKYFDTADFLMGSKLPPNAAAAQLNEAGKQALDAKVAEAETAGKGEAAKVSKPWFGGYLGGSDRYNKETAAKRDDGVAGKVAETLTAAGSPDKMREAIKYMMGDKAADGTTVRTSVTPEQVGKAFDKMVEGGLNPKAVAAALKDLPKEVSDKIVGAMEETRGNSVTAQLPSVPTIENRSRKQAVGIIKELAEATVTVRSTDPRKGSREEFDPKQAANTLGWLMNDGGGDRTYRSPGYDAQQVGALIAEAGIPKDKAARIIAAIEVPGVKDQNQAQLVRQDIAQAAGIPAKDVIPELDKAKKANTTLDTGREQATKATDVVAALSAKEKRAEEAGVTGVARSTPSLRAVSAILGPDLGAGRG